MKKSLAVGSGLTVFLASLLVGAGMAKATGVLSTEDRINAQIQYDNMVIGSPGFLGQPMRYVETQQKEARQDLARCENELAALKSPSKYSQADLEKFRIAAVERAIRRDRGQS